jgi:hypothetical protein
MWLRFFTRACTEQQSIRELNDPDARREKATLVRRFLKAAAKVRSGDTRLGPVTRYADTRRLQALALETAAKDSKVGNLFNRLAEQATVERVDLMAPVSEPSLWEHYSNTLPRMAAEPRPADATLH